MHEELAITPSFVLEVSCVSVGFDVGVEQPQLAVPEKAVGIGEVGAPEIEALHLGAHQNQPGFESLNEFEVEPRSAVLYRFRTDALLSAPLLTHRSASVLPALGCLGQFAGKVNLMLPWRTS